MADNELTFNALQSRRQAFQLGRREPGSINPDGTGLPDDFGKKTISSRWVRFVFSVQEDASITIQEREDPASIAFDWENVGRHMSGRILTHAFDPNDARTIPPPPHTPTPSQTTSLLPDWV